MKSVRAIEVFKHLSTVPTHIRNHLEVFSNLRQIEKTPPIGIIPVAEGYRNELMIQAEFWVDPAMPLAMEKQLRISKQIILRHLYGDVLDQLLPVKRELCNGNAREAFRLIEELEKSILNQE